MPVVQRHAVVTVDSATDKATVLVGESRGIAMRAGSARKVTVRVVKVSRGLLGVRGGSDQYNSRKHCQFQHGAAPQLCSYTLPLAKLSGIGFTHACDLCLLITRMGLPQPRHRTRSSLAPYDNKAAALLAVAARTPAPSPKKKYTGPAATARPRNAIVSHGLTDPVAGPSTN
jgi:hypothetical protein